MNKLHLYMGDGKGKTTAAMGLALRGLGHGRRVLVAQFMKRGDSGELIALRKFDDARVMTAEPIRGFTFRMDQAQRDKTRMEQTAFALSVMEEIESFRPETVVLDEIGMALDTGMLDGDMARRLIDKALSFAETVTTGRRAPEWLMDRADYLSRIEADRHPYATEGLTARKGIEW